jgi:enamine deaminase RidA (YjgF/YER057c/UK114 family)
MNTTTKKIIGGPVEFGGTMLPLSMAVRAGDFVYVSGMVACDANGKPDLSGDIEQQTRLSLRAIEKQLIEAGCAMTDVVKAVIYLKTREDFPIFNAAYAEFFPEFPPARTSVCTDFVAEGVLVEIDIVAYRPE